MKKMQSDKTCPECGHDPVDHFFEGKSFNMYKKSRRDRKMAADHCKEHEMLHSSDKCKPIWCRSCKHLKIYQITVTEKSRNITPNFDKKRK